MRAFMIAAIVCAASPAFAWDGPGMWYAAADGTTPGRSLGGGGILGTGGQHDYGIKCSDCHVQPPTETISLTLTPNPAFVNGTYVPGQRYQMTATMNGGNLPCTTGPNGGGMKVRNFAASFEDDNGAAAGALASDSGQSAPSCALPAGTPTGTTALDGDCAVIFGTGKDLTSWTFTWTAPTSGPVHVYWGAVDGNCDMMSMGDAVTNSSMTLATPPMMRAAPEPLIAQLLVALVRWLDA
jgi:hypothetical protein